MPAWNSDQWADGFSKIMDWNVSGDETVCQEGQAGRVVSVCVSVRQKSEMDSTSEKLWKAEQYLGRVHGPNIDSVSPFTSAQLVIHNIWWLPECVLTVYYNNEDSGLGFVACSCSIDCLMCTNSLLPLVGVGASSIAEALCTTLNCNTSQQNTGK